MTDLLAARAQMGLSLAFHIVFAVVGIGMPLMMVLAEYRWLKSGREVFLVLTKRWAKGTAVLFAVGAVSGTVLSFELGLLWPGFMKFAGPIIGMPFSLEGFAFFTEAIFLGLYLYGWDRLRPWVHWMTGVLVALSGLLSGVFVVTANAWMNQPAGFELVDGKIVDIRPLEAMLNPASFSQTLHMTLAAYLSTAAVVAGLHASQLLKKRTSEFHSAALRLALPIMVMTGLLQMVSGDLSGRFVAKYQPEKFAALEGQFKTEKGAPLRLGGIPNEQTMETPYAIEIPYLLSLVAFHNPYAEVKGLEEFPRDEWPNSFIVHLSFQIMVGCGMILVLVSLTSWLWIRKRGAHELSQAWFLKWLKWSAPLGFIGVEAGWVVTEVGRQPWIIYRIMKTADAVTPMPWLVVPFLGFSLIYLFLGWVVWRLLRWQVVNSLKDEEKEKERGR